MSLKQNIIYLYFKGKHLITSKSQYQYNHGQYLYFADLNLPQAFEVHFSNKNRGESKAAGDTTQSQSSNAVGQYTEEAKRAIREMLGLPRYTEAEIIADITTEEDATIITIDTDQGGNEFELRTVKMVVVLPASTTGVADYISASMSVFTDLNEYESMSFPTNRMNNKDSSVNNYEARIDGGIFDVASFCSSRLNATSGSVTSFSRLTIAKYIRSLTVKQYSATSTLIPAGTRILIQGIRA